VPTELKAPTFDELMWPALNAMKALGGSATHEELLDKVIELEHIPGPIQNLMHTDRQTKIGYNLAWAKTYLGKVGAFENPSHGVWAITKKGTVLSQEDVKHIPVEVRKLAKLQKEKKNQESSPEKDIDLEAKNWKDELLTLLVKNVSPEAFERLAQRILRESGFVKVEVTRRSGDGGIDGVGSPFGLFSSASVTRVVSLLGLSEISEARWLAAQIKDYSSLPEHSHPKQRKKQLVMEHRPST
jgi:restriction system protein